jgi:hypothetical protein
MPKRASFVVCLGLLAGCGSSHPAPTPADGKILEKFALESVSNCLKIKLAQIAGVPRANERIAEAEQARESLSHEVNEVVALVHRVDINAEIPYGEGRHITTKQDIQTIIKNLSEIPTSSANSPACSPELAKKLEEGISQ